MMKKGIAAFGLSLILLLGFVVIVVEVIPPAYAAGIIYVDDEPGVGPGNPAENYTRIQDAIDNASPGDTVFVYNGTYYENVVVDKTINLTGEGKNATIINGGGGGNTLRVEADWVNVTDFTLTNTGDGINIDSYSNNTISNVTSHVLEGIYPAVLEGMPNLFSTS